MVVKAEEDTVVVDGKDFLSFLPSPDLMVPPWSVANTISQRDHV